MDRDPPFLDEGKVRRPCPSTLLLVLERRITVVIALWRIIFFGRDENEVRSKDMNIHSRIMNK